MDGLQSRSGLADENKNSQLLPGLESPTVQPVAQRYTSELYIPAPKTMQKQQMYNFAEQIPSWESCSLLPSQEIPHTLWDSKVHYHVNRNPLLVHILSNMNPYHNLLPNFFMIHVNVILASKLKSLSRGLFPSYLLTHMLYAILITSMRAVCPFHLFYVCVRVRAHANSMQQIKDL
jgi:hypothetical protein